MYRYMPGKQFNENSLREAIIERWGPAGVHVDIFDRILAAAKKQVLAWPLKIKTRAANSEQTLEIIVNGDKPTKLLHNNKTWYLTVGAHLVIVPPEEIIRLWPVIRYAGIAGKHGAYFQIEKPKE